MCDRRKDLKLTNPSSVLKASSVYTEGTEFSFNFVDRAAIPSAAHPCPNRPREFRPSPVIVVILNEFIVLCLQFLMPEFVFKISSPSPTVKYSP